MTKTTKTDDKQPLTMDDIARRFLNTPPAPKPTATPKPKKKPRKRAK